MKSIYQQESELLDALKQSYPSELQDKIVYDGLCWASISSDLPDANNQFWPENLWTTCKRKVLFLLKEPRDEGEDYRDWDWGINKDQFGNVLLGWLYSIMNVTSRSMPDYTSIPSRKELSKLYPLAIVNLKKLSGGRTADWEDIWRYAERDKVFLKKQVRDILKPTIVVCGGSNNDGDNYRKVMTIALEYIFDDIKDNFKNINDWCYFSSEDNILLIDSFHPSAIKTFDEKTLFMAEAVKEFLSITETSY